ncbi:uncharacterized protein LOC128626167 [Artibeus jamaicensis]|uniref:uncharacterized protein LOC128626167 n=1 Tax=Artibeus jamaicensis TaxID=9417 RepID=UPI00235A5DC3|nr:uncharacterized protein LOC128626167 [Artibeus jamaicensis]XP_053513267.1 uncharacterized protein LOC128626167 [Artibeus jamaicensis]XP_053513268.1 uncharacterized protein LOC128626167 [Artibeus jamaicensis]
MTLESSFPLQLSHLNPRPTLYIKGSRAKYKLITFPHLILLYHGNDPTFNMDTKSKSLGMILDPSSIILHLPRESLTHVTVISQVKLNTSRRHSLSSVALVSYLEPLSSRPNTAATTLSITAYNQKMLSHSRLMCRLTPRAEAASMLQPCHLPHVASKRLQQQERWQEDDVGGSQGQGLSLSPTLHCLELRLLVLTELQGRLGNGSALCAQRGDTNSLEA